MTHLPRLVRAELLKLRSIRMTWGLLIGGLVFSTLGVVGTLLTAGQQGVPEIDTPERVRDLLVVAGNVSPLVLVLGILVSTGEYRHHTIASVLLAEPVRMRVVLAKVLAGALAGAAFTAVALAAGLAVAVPWLSAQGISVTTGGLAGVALGSLAAWALWCAIGVGVGALIRNQVAAIVGALVFEIGVDGILAALLPDVGKFLPGSAAAALAGSGGGSQVVLPTVLGALVLLGYLAVATGLGGLAVVRRDVSD